MEAAVAAVPVGAAVEVVGAAVADKLTARLPTLPQPAAALPPIAASLPATAGLFELNASLDDFKGFPSSMIEGTYDLTGPYASSRIGLPLEVGAQVRVVAAKDGMKATRLNVLR